MLHLFHFKATEKLLERLAVPFALSGMRKFAEFLGYVLLKMYPVLEERHFFGKSQGGKYVLIDSDMKVERVSVFAEIPDWLYRRLKLVYQDRNLFSMARMVRELLVTYLVLVEEHGEDWERQLKKLCRRAQRQCRKIAHKAKITLQLLGKKTVDRYEPQHFTFYGAGFEPLGYFRC